MLLELIRSILGFVALLQLFLVLSSIEGRPDMARAGVRRQEEEEKKEVE